MLASGRDNRRCVASALALITTLILMLAGGAQADAAKVRVKADGHSKRALFFKVQGSPREVRGAHAQIHRSRRSKRGGRTVGRRVQVNAVRNAMRRGRMVRVRVPKNTRRGSLMIMTRPETAITAGPRTATSEVSPVFEFGSASGVGFECQVDAQAEWSACTSPLSLTDLAEGRHSLRVRAIDRGGVADDTPAERVFDVDLTAPDTAIDELTVDGGAVGYSASSTEEGSSFECRIDDGVWKTCEAAATVADLAPGSHRLQIRAIDRAGNVDAVPAGDNFAIDQPAEPQNTGAIPGTGAIIAEDLASQNPLLALWYKINPGITDRVQTFSSGGDTHELVGGGTNTSYREVSIEDGDRATGDSTSRERVHVGARGTALQRTFHKFREGEEVILYNSFRLQDEAPDFPDPNGRGAYSKTQMWQIIHDQSCGESPRIHMYEYANKVALVTSEMGVGETTLWSAPVERGEWYRMAVKLKMSTDPGQGLVEVWGDMDQDGELEQLSDTITTNTLHGGACGDSADLFFGRYQNSSIGPSHIDFANWQLTRWVR
ncbi:hypothetical protein HJD18_07040 [Thermoleophilia bacterium SCSIO 60948]|nr:hypothetical protein HJD18_07040 [Thermoleophilia bacterium SCSIO 60948]